jgi:hypothetical protein
VPEDLRGVERPVLYLEALFGPNLAEEFGLRMLEPPVDWLPQLPAEYRNRQVELMTLQQARSLQKPAFIKPPNDKSFPAKVYTGAELPHGYDEISPVLVSEIVAWEVEYRCFVLNREPRAMSVYLRHGELQKSLGFVSPEAERAEAEAFVRVICADARVDLPRTAVLDVGIIAGRGWSVVEQNSAWGAGLYGCDPAEVLQVLEHASTRIID